MTQVGIEKGEPTPFWTFSLSVYGRKGVPPACLTLQDTSGVDVNVLLFCLFLGTQGRALAASDAAAIAALVDPWKRDVVVSLRAARRALKEPPAGFSGPAVEGLRKSVKSAELEAERIQQETLFVSFPAGSTGTPAPDATRACSDNVEAYRQTLGTAFDEAALATILEAVAGAVSASRERSK